MESQGRKIHGEAAQARESGESLKALQLIDEAIITYQEAKNYLGVAEALADRSLSLRHLYQKTNDKAYLHIANAEMEASVEIAKESGDKTALALPYFNLAKIQEELGKLDKALANYKQALEYMISNPPVSHNRAAVLADMKMHTETCAYATGDKSALERAEKALEELKTSDEVSYNKNVWVSGAHMRIATALKTDDLEKAEEYLQKAKEIIDSDSRLELRKKQWEKLAESFK